MVNITIKNISSLIENDSLFLTHISTLCETDLSFNKFLNLVFKHNILVFEKNIDSQWSFKSKTLILNQIDKCMGILYNDHTINITKIQIENDSFCFDEIEKQLDKIHLDFKKKLIDLYELKNLLMQNKFNGLVKPVQQINFKKKKIINNDIYIEEFSN